MPLYDDDGNELTPDQAIAYLQGQQVAPPQQDEPGWRKQLRDRATTAEAAAQTEKARADAAEKQLAFAKAGVPLAQDPANPNPMVDYFVNGYQGDLTPEAIRAEAARLNLVPPPAQQAPAQQLNPTAQQAAQQAFSQIAEATHGQTVPAGRDWDAEKSAAPTREALHQLVREQAQAEGRQTPVIVND